MLLLPDTDLLVLVGQVEPIAIVVVVGLDVVGGISPEVLHATLRCQVWMVAGVLGDLHA